MFLQLPRGTRFIHPSLRFGLRHLRAVALRLPFGTIFKISPSIRRRAFFVSIFLGGIFELPRQSQMFLQLPRGTRFIHP